MEIIFLGTGTIYPDPRRRAPGLALVCGDAVLVFDSGPGTWFRLAEAGLDFRTVAAIFYSHLHPDHILDYPAYLFLTHSPDFAREGELRVFAPKGFERFHAALHKLFGAWMEPHQAKIALTLLPRRTRSFDFRGLSVTSAPVRHSATSLAFRVTDGEKTFVYGGDLDYGPAGGERSRTEIIKLAKNADLLVTECAFPEEDPRPGHLTPSLAAKIAAAAQVKQLALTHFYPATTGRDLLAPARAVFPGEIILARDLLRIRL